MKRGNKQVNWVGSTKVDYCTRFDSMVFILSNVLSQDESKA